MAALEFTVQLHKHGIAVLGPYPLDLVPALAKMGEIRGYDVIDAGIAHAIGATLVLTNARSGSQWRYEIEEENAERLRDDECAWLNGIDTGVSSLTMYCAMTGNRFPRPNFIPDVPHDVGDFGRCVRMLEKLPHLRPRLHEVAEHHAMWIEFVERWDELEAHYAKLKADHQSDEDDVLRAKIEAIVDRAYGRKNS